MHQAFNRGLRPIILLAMALALPAFAQTTPPRPAASSKPATQPLPPGWEEVDQRLVFLTVQLSTIESSIEATDKALKLHGYQKIAQEAAANRAAKGNELMDRNGGGPVAWQEFYGKTAEKFFYHPTDRNTVYVNPHPVAQRPPQFDYIYRANEEHRAKAEAEATRIGDKIDDLLAYRKQLETEQTALWCKIAFRGGSSLDLSSRPLYRLELTNAASDDTGKQQLQAARAAVVFMRAVDAELTRAQKGMDDQKEALEHLASTTAAARTELQGKLLQLPALTPALANPRDPLGQFTRLAKRLEDSAQNLSDALRLAGECDAQGDLAAKRNYRGQLQQTAFEYASTVVAADQALTAAVTTWKITPSVTKPAAATAPAAVASAADAHTIAGRLEAAKAAHEQALAAARRIFVAAIDARLNAAADAGDLAGVQSFQAAKIKAAHDGSLADTITDPAVVAAKKAMDQSIDTAHATLVAAYKQAISDYTKGRKIGEALAVQEELNASGLVVATPATESPDTTTATVTTVSPTHETNNVPTATGPGAFTPPALPKGRLEVGLAAPADEVAVGGAGRYLILHLKKLRQLAIFDVSQAKVIKYLPMPSSDICFAAGLKKLYVGFKDLKRIQRWDLARADLELTVAAPEGGIGALATGASSLGPVVMIGDNSKKFWLVNPATLRAQPYPSKNWGTEGSAWGPVHVHVSFDGSTVVACGGGWAGIELSTLSGNKVTGLHAGSYVNGDTLVSGNGALVFPDGGGMIRSDLTSKVSGIDGKPFPADDPAFSLAFHKDKKKPSLVIYSNADPRPLITLRDLPELAQDSKMPLWQRVHLIPAGKVLVTLGEGHGHLLLRPFDLTKELDAEGIDYLFVESAPLSQARRGMNYRYKMQILSKRGGVKAELQAGPKGMTVSKEGVINWAVPMRPTEDHATVIVQISDASGQTIFHSFGIDLTENVTRR
jgi:hypothetical protein